MKKLYTIIYLTFLAGVFSTSYAQNMASAQHPYGSNAAAQAIELQQDSTAIINGIDIQAEADSLVSPIAATVDSTLIGRPVMAFINEGGGAVEINRSAAIDMAFEKHLKNNAEKKINGYRVRIFFDNKQTARVQSEEVEKLFKENFPQIPVYRSYTNPYFKVAVGDCRSKSDAAKILREIQYEFPNAFIIRDAINYPL